MKYGIISDIHSNIEALNTVLNDMEEVDIIICLGDIVGYGANPNECVHKIRELNPVCIIGNHDVASVNLSNIDYFNPEAREAIIWTADQLKSDNRNFLEHLKYSVNINKNILAVHGSPGRFKWNYITDNITAKMIFQAFDFDILLIGHSHIAECFFQDKENNKLEHVDLSLGKHFSFLKNKRYIINCGSVGQPRDGNPKASYGIFDDEKMEIRINRIKYPLFLSQKKILDAKLPEIFAYRLSIGR